ncbi:MAG TPA: TonB family protein [Burkholderiales bacterium]|nr:TonB family protein [Burkholderiales bacterium]
MDRCFRSHRRFAAAVAFSALAHVVASMSIAPGFPGTRAPAGAGFLASVSARLVLQDAEPPQVQPAPAREETWHAAPPAPRLKRRDAAPPAQLVKAESSGAAAMPDPTYYPARQLDVYPMLASGLDRSYFETAKAYDVKARVLLLVLIDAAGSVDDVSIAEGSAPDELEQAARRAFLAARFKPAQKNGRAVKSRVLIEVNYGSETAPRAD